MEVKRAFRKYLGPDDPGPFSDMINSMSFGCRHMKEYNKNGVFCLKRKTENGTVKLLRVGDVDYIWTQGGVEGLIYIILIPDLVVGYKIKVTIEDGYYVFGSVESIKEEDFNLIRYEYPRDYEGQTGADNRRQYMPYIVKESDSNYASVGNPGGGLGSELFLDPVNDWHYKHYILDCTGDQDPVKEHLWRPPGQYTAYGFGEEITPTWYSMSRATAHTYHFCFEAAIDQSKRIYQPVNIDVTLSSEDVIVPAFTLAARSGKRYNFLYPTTANRFYGKNAFDYIKDSEGRVTITAFGESIYMSGVVTPTIPSGITPILFFWPWIPYLDDIRAFNILTYLWTQPEGGGTEAWYMKPIFETLKKWSIGFYTAEGTYQTIPLSEDSATFSDVTYSSVPTSSNTPNPCSCGECGTGVWNSQTVTTVPPYSASGIRHIPIGLIGGKIPITMKTEWSQSGSGPVDTDTQQWTVTGTYPWDSLHGSMNGLDYWYESCCIQSFSSSSHRSGVSISSASNKVEMVQTLKVGDDVIFSGESSMDYEMTYNGTETYDGTITGTVTPPAQEIPVCAGHINYTSQQMNINQTQNLSWTDDTVYPAAPVCEDPMPAFTFSWSLSGGGSLNSTTEQNIVYTAPASNANCANNSTISLLCNGVVVDTLDIAINTGGTGTAYYSTVCVTEGHCEEPVQVGNQWVTQFTVATVRITRYNCAGTETGTTTYCMSGEGSCARTLAQGPMSCEDCLASKTVTSCGIKYSRANHLSCAGKALECGAWCVYGLTDGPELGELVDVRTPAQIAAGCCPAPLM